LLSGDIATNPGPYKHTDRVNRVIKCLALNARSLISLHETNIGNNLTYTNIERFQNLIYSEDPDIVCANETWLKVDIKNSEILHSGYDIFRNDRESRGGGVLLAIKISSFKSVREIKRGHELDHDHHVTLASGPPPPSHGPNKSSTSAPKPTNPSGIFDGPRSKSRPSLFVGIYILPSFVPTWHTRLKSGLHKLLTSLSVQNAFKDVRQNTYWTYLSSVTSAITIVSQHWIYYLCVTGMSI
jgi:hypothetical protein